MGWLAIAMVAVPLIAWVVSRIVVHGGFEAHWWMRRKQYEPWHGKYYEFGGIHLRAAELEDERLVFVESDLLKVIGQADSTTVRLFGATERLKLDDTGDMVLTQAGCERLLVKSPHAEAKKLLLFLQRDCFKPHAKKHERVPA